MNNATQNYEAIARTTVAHLVHEQIIGNMTPTGYALKKPVFGWQGDLSFPSVQDAINQLTPVFASYLEKQQGLKVAS